MDRKRKLQAIIHHRKSLWLLLLPMVFFLPGLFAFPYPTTDAAYSDLVITHYPNVLFLRRALLEWHTIPLWSPTILSGYPFAANPLSGLWYPPGWLAVFLPLPFGFNLLIALHMLWGGIGMVRLQKKEGMSHAAALFGALAFESMPKLFAHYGVGHLTLIYAVCWTPWLLAAALPRLPARRPARLSPLAQPGFILALIFLADPRWAMFAGVLWWGYVLAHSQYSANHASESSPTPSRFQSLLRNLVFLFSQTLLAALLAAPLALPLLEYARLSTRAHLTPQEALAFSLPFPRLLGLLFPDFGGFHEWMLYPGGLVLVLGVVAVFQKRLTFAKRFWVWVAFLSLLFSLGSQIPLLPLLARLPGFDWLRVPSRALFLTGMAFAALSARGLDALSSELPGLGRSARLALVGLVSFEMIFVGVVWVVNDRLPFNFAWGAALALAGAVWVAARSRVKSALALRGVLFGLALVDWGAAALSGYAPRSPGLVFSESKAVMEFLAAQPARFRVYSPSYSLPQQMAARAALELADGVDPLQLEAYAAFMEQASGVPRPDYSVTLPPFVGDPKQANTAYRPDARRLGLLNVRFVVAEFEIAAEGLRLRETFGRTRLYENMAAMPRAWLDVGGVWTEAEVVLWTPNRVVLHAAGPGLLVLSEIAYPGWGVRLDGERAKMHTAEGLLRAVWLPPGEHEVAFIFQPTSLYLGLFLFALGVLYFLIAGVTGSAANL
jgi:hypothetical protein